MLGRQFSLEDNMLISISMIAFSSQLVIAVADNVPKFDIARGCKIDSASAFDPNAGMNATIRDVWTTSNVRRISFKRNGRGLPTLTE
jgi:hypothetical protein